ncbi:energy transducer TonB [Marinobacterium arenosum]|uniref:energy transducer TonB n=1 Tax=Marinobacterium arenosum TaxID=2862496 RepID=UPI001C972EE5|nr:energy transducer TonB [Marinobacterium arenosum]MBY4678295.1 energy transducer TonB [Marinobacterium arenosum]
MTDISHQSLFSLIPALLLSLLLHLVLAGGIWWYRSQQPAQPPGRPSGWAGPLQTRLVPAPRRETVESLERAESEPLIEPEPEPEPEPALQLTPEPEPEPPPIVKKTVETRRPTPSAAKATPVVPPPAVKQRAQARQSAPSPSEQGAEAPAAAAESLAPAPEEGPVELQAPQYAMPATPPDYPLRALRRGWQGQVLLQLQLDAVGRVTAVEVVRSSGYPVLDRAAEQAARRWRFKPAIRHGRPVASYVKIPVDFQLKDQRR